MKPISDTLDQLIWLSQFAFSVSLALASISVCIATDIELIVWPPRRLQFVP